MSNTSSIGRKIIMALSGLFLLLFLANHFLINFFSVLDTMGVTENLFNEGSEFMASNPLIQIMQPVLAIGFIIHIIMGIKLTLQNSSARNVNYTVNNPAANSSFASRYMIVTGGMVLLFLLLHLKDFFFNIKFTPDYGGSGSDYQLLMDNFSNPAIVGVYVLAFLLLAIHLWHGFQSAFQSIGINHPKYTPVIKLIGVIYSIAIPLGFAFIAIFQFVSQL